MKGIKVRWLCVECNARTVDGSVLRAGQEGFVDAGTLKGAKAGEQFEKLTSPKPKKKATDSTTEE